MGKLSRIPALVLLVGVTACYEGLEEPRTVRSFNTEVAFPFSEPDDVGQGWFPVGGEMQMIPYQIVEGYAVAEGDIILGRADELSAVERGETEPPRSAVKPDQLWPNATIPYAVAPSLSVAGQTAAFFAVLHWNDRTSVRLVPRTNEADYVVFQGGEGCSSYIGRIGGPQAITLAPECGTAAAIHEIGHAAGLWHEQSRADRDQYVDVFWGNIIPGEEHNFETHVAKGLAGVDVGPYDYDSVMHYSSWAFSINGVSPTIRRKDGSLIPYHDDELSPGDLGGIASLYGGPLQPPEGCGVLRAQQVIGPEQTVASCDGRFTLVMQADGNAVLYRNGSGALWATNTAGSGGQSLVMQADGNLVIYAGNGAPVWSSGTHGHAASLLAVQDDGNLVVYQGNTAIWSSHTCCH